MECFTNERLTEKYYTECKDDSQRLENVSKVMSYMRTKNLRTQNVDPGGKGDSSTEFSVNQKLFMETKRLSLPYFGLYYGNITYVAILDLSTPQLMVY
jgi:hypothetical protein